MPSTVAIIRSPAGTLGRVVVGGCTWALGVPGVFSVAVPAAIPIGAMHNSPARAKPIVVLSVGNMGDFSSPSTIRCFIPDDASSRQRMPVSPCEPGYQRPTEMLP
jgi:hypothetical protein